ncbi:hypothetical protein LJC56_06750 [Christensenellaceae bacterium OttesenSCG-928-K19]|nr:hypothetical protein [Christensenellaceae bacterium OttesenSCG-928-K19]
MKRILISIMTICLCTTVLNACFLSTSQSKSNVESPITELESVEEINSKTGFEMPLFPDPYQQEAWSVIDNTIAQMEYAYNGAQITFRMAEGKDDISGIYGIEEYETTTLNGITAQTEMYNDIHVAWFPHEPYTYSLTATDMNGTDFIALLTTVTGLIASPPEPSEGE